MDTRHPKWGEFVGRLSKALETVPCKAGTNKDEAKKILKGYKDVDIKKTLEFFENNGGFCDCEILMNVDKAA